jgi:hypothetical protein
MTDEEWTAAVMADLEPLSPPISPAPPRRLRAISSLIPANRIVEMNTAQRLTPRIMLEMLVTRRFQGLKATAVNAAFLKRSTFSFPPFACRSAVVTARTKKATKPPFERGAMKY